METTNETGEASNANGSDKAKLVEKYARPRYDSPAKPKPIEREPSDDADEPADGSYRGLIKYRGRRGNPRFRIVNRLGVSYGCGYAYMLGWLLTPPDTLSIQTTTHLFTIAGTGMQTIENALIREMVMEIREFNPGQDVKPPDGEPVITHLEVVDRLQQTAKKAKDTLAD
ncbi:hypothetical protein GCM10028808_57740 [Spirosoma migulaei]